MFLSTTNILGDAKASKYSETQIVESLTKLPKIQKINVSVNSKYVHLCDFLCVCVIAILFGFVVC